ncbi:MAG TPA: hypothetical protein VFA92_09410, partial [Candidatus Binatia bacterium]|nr:hypothetical protein [Candidatus Binatia bacterium]
MSAHRWTRAAAALVLVAGTVRGRAQAQSSDPTLARAVASLEVTETERGVELLRQLITTLPTTAPAALRRDAQVHLAIADWSLGLFDSASAHLRAAVTADPFVHLDGEEFNPDLVAALRAARRAVAALGVRAPPDTSLEPRTGGWPVAVAVTQPGTVRLRLTGPESGGRDTLLAALPVDSTATLTLPLPVGESLARTAGSYRLVVEYARPGGPTLTSTLDLDVTEQPVDTLPREPP